MASQTTLPSSQPVPVINQLPFELLAKIFVHSAQKPVHPVNEWCIPKYPRETLVEADLSGTLNIARVCRQWRNVVLAIPELWKMIKISTAEDAVTFAESLPLPLHVLGRSPPSSVFLTLIFRPTKVFTEADVGHIPVTPEIKNIKGMDVQGDSHIRSSALFGWMHQFPNLTHLSLINIHVDHDAVCIPDPLRSRLTHLHVYLWFDSHVNRFFDNRLSPSLNRPWSSLTSLTVEMPNWVLENHILRAILARSPNLVELFIVAGEVDPDQNWTATSSRTLRTFSFWVEGASLEENVLVALFGALSFPSLSNLIVTAPPRCGNLAFISRFLRRSKCRLSSLTLTNVKTEDSEWFENSEVRRAAVSIGEEFAIPSVEFAFTTAETRVYQASKERWYDLDSSWL
ncbi:hypothetical protein CONPUDRAFT_166083 [Coniophora puteana RWD-64-598 SS2]|uniref:F-box domain-containing protein n=1 Tax=Coniophora puteana (strain RWD-64-598) TaxID=741705 RepID=A0A5M3MNH8_CONPW|nr:uncharacterized protein CONPUDRAFT_166083 [Coniophora puteana RWD-64-598 SS2]EIW80596.1 hypothetical protein CONPUDRAFT_166083 [Coniophora puteana RWD-64-598 SS2]